MEQDYKMKSDIIQSMSLREKIGQTAILKSMDLIEVDKKEEFFKKYPYAGFYVFDKNLAQVFGYNPEKQLSTSSECRIFVESCNEASNLPLLVAADAEGGGGSLFDDLTRMGNLMQLGASNDETLAHEWGKYLALELKKAGINWTFMPNCDLNLHPLTHILNTRSISDNKETANKLLPEIVKGIQSCGVASCAKHFPGQGEDIRDGHIVMNVNEMSREQWYETQGSVYQKMIDCGVYTFMSGHIAFPAFQIQREDDGELIPTSASHEIVTGLLKENMNFDGVVITDAIQMRGMTCVYEREQSYIEALKAGNDLILFPNTDYIDIIERAVISGEISKERLDDAVLRVLKLKEKLGLFQESKLEYFTISEELNTTIKSFNSKLAQAGITLIKDKGSMLPLDNSIIKKALIVCISHFEPAFEILNVIKHTLSGYGIEVDMKRHLTFADDMQIIAESYDLIIYAAFIAPFMPVGTPFFYGEEAMTLWQSLSAGKEKSIAVSFGSPYLYNNYFETSNVYINAYSIDPESQIAFTKAIFGEIPFKGISPVRI